MDKAINLYANYTDWLKQNTLTQQVDDEWHEIITPYLTANNDHVEVYVKYDASGKEQDIVLQAVRSLQRDTVNNTLFVLNDIVKRQPQFQPLAVIKDTEKFNPELLEAFNAYNVPYLHWSKPSLIAERLRA